MRAALMTFGGVAAERRNEHDVAAFDSRRQHHLHLVIAAAGDPQAEAEQSVVNLLNHPARFAAAAEGVDHTAARGRVDHAVQLAASIVLWAASTAR
jgi:hypothetical protein